MTAPVLTLEEIPALRRELAELPAALKRALQAGDAQRFQELQIRQLMLPTQIIAIVAREAEIAAVEVRQHGAELNAARSRADAALRQAEAEMQEAIRPYREKAARQAGRLKEIADLCQVTSFDALTMGQLRDKAQRLLDASVAKPGAAVPEEEIALIVREIEKQRSAVAEPLPYEQAD